MAKVNDSRFDLLRSPNGYDEPFIPDNRYDRLLMMINRDPAHPAHCCPAHRRFFLEDDMLLFDLVSTPQYEKVEREVRQRLFRECPVLAKERALKYNPSKSNHKHMGTWAGTLTMSPNDPENEDSMVMAMRKIFCQKTCPLKRYAWYLEYTANGLPHIHFIYETISGGRIHKRVFQRVWKQWDEDMACGAGHRGGYHRECHDDEEYMKYISKDKGRCEVQWS